MTVPLSSARLPRAASTCRFLLLGADSSRLGGFSSRFRRLFAKPARSGAALFANNGSGEGQTVDGGLLGLANRFTPLQEGWVQLAPYGDHPKTAFINGKKETVLQRLDGESAGLMVGDFDQLRQKLGDKFGGLPFYEGHPDVPGMANIFTDRRAYGWIEELRAGAAGLDAKVKWSETAEGWIKSGHFKFYSPYWMAMPLGNSSTALRGALVFRPVRLISAGLTNDPNIAVMPLANTTTTPTTQETTMDPRLILCRLLALPNTATDEQINTALEGVGTISALQLARTTAETNLANVSQERDRNAAALILANSQLAAERVNLANVRKEYATTLVDSAIAGGRLTAAEKGVTLAGFTTDFANSLNALAARPKVIKTTSTTSDVGARKTVAFDNARDRQAEVQRLVREEEARLKTGGVEDAYGQAFANVENAHPELFTAMKRPAFLKREEDAA